MKQKVTVITTLILLLLLIGVVWVSIHIYGITGIPAIIALIGVALGGVVAVIAGWTSLYTFIEDKLLKAPPPLDLEKKVAVRVLAKLNEYGDDDKIQDDLFYGWLVRNYPEESQRIYDELKDKQYVELADGRVTVLKYGIQYLRKNRP